MTGVSGPDPGDEQKPAWQVAERIQVISFIQNAGWIVLVAKRIKVVSFFQNFGWIQLRICNVEKWGQK